jgi:chorismate mutase
VACAVLRCAGKERRYKVEPGVLAQLYDSIIMPLTKEVQVAYLLRRLDA